MERESRDLKGGSMRKVMLSIVAIAAMVSWDCATQRAGADGVQGINRRTSGLKRRGRTCATASTPVWISCAIDRTGIGL